MIRILETLHWNLKVASAHLIPKFASEVPQARANFGIGALAMMRIAHNPPAGMSAHGALESVCEVGPFPGKAAILFEGAPEMPIRRRSAIDRAREFQRAPNAGRPQGKDRRQHLLQ